ncbi:pre-toxin TG domain-containing protein [Metabacillus mangrovi]
MENGVLVNAMGHKETESVRVIDEYSEWNGTYKRFENGQIYYVEGKRLVSSIPPNRVGGVKSVYDQDQWGQGVSDVVDFIPILGNAKSGIEGITGHNAVTFEKLSGIDQGLAAAGIVGGLILKVGKKVVKGIGSLSRNQRVVLTHLNMILRKEDTLIFMVRMGIITFTTIDKEGIKMPYQNEKIQKKIALMNAKKTVNQLSYLELIDFEEYDSMWLELIELPLKQFRRLNSEPTFSKPVEGSIGDISWFENSLKFLKGKKEWFILVPNSQFPVWANVKVLDSTNAIAELWETSENRDIILADKSTGSIAQIFLEEKNYEIHFGKCDVTNIDTKNI